MLRLGSISDFLADDFTVQWLIKKSVDHRSCHCARTGHGYLIAGVTLQHTAEPHAGACSKARLESKLRLELTMLRANNTRNLRI
jgi:hypothetical protein